MTSTDFDNHFYKSFLAHLLSKSEDDSKKIMNDLKFDLAANKKKVELEATPYESMPTTTDIIVAAPTTKARSAYIEFGNNIHAKLRKKYPTFTPQEIISEKARLWNLKKKNPALTEEQLLGCEEELTNDIVLPPQKQTQALIVKPETMKILTKKRKIPKHVRQQVWNEYIGQDLTRYKCLCCNKTVIDLTNFECGHVIAETNGGDETISNLRPICSGCNRGMGTRDMREYALTNYKRDLGF